MSRVPAVAVIGHTNVGKTSLMRTLTRERSFGEISAHPATTRHVELAELAVAGRPILHLFDTPGFEDSSGLLAHIERLRAQRGEDWLESLRAFASEAKLHAGFSQEAMALRQILQSDVLLYVVDARDAVRAKHRDELELLGRTARPVLPVLNFITHDTGHESEWREQLARVNMHAVVPFDTVVYRENDEITLYTKMATLADGLNAPLSQLIEQLRTARAALRRSSATLIAELLIDVAAARRAYPVKDEDQKASEAARLQDMVRTRERQAVDALLKLHRFADQDYAPAELPFAHGEWQQDLFDPEVLEQFGFNATRALATGAAAGLVIDLVAGGLTLGAAAATGAGIGFAIDSIRRYGKQVVATIQGQAEVTVDDATLHSLLAREVVLTAALLGRGHAAQRPIVGEVTESGDLFQRLAPTLRKARRQKDWSTLNDARLTTSRAAAIRTIATPIETAISDERKNTEEV